jgi:SAM-dependent methyltransferase
MTANPASAEWRTTRGEKWLSQLSGMEATLKPLDAPLLEALRLEAPCRIADVGCGGGGTSLELLRRAPAGSVVHGFDISPPLVEVARGRAGPDARGITFEVADVATTVPGQGYDRLASRLGTMFFDDPPAAFANLARWLAPGGRFAFLVWAPPSENPWLTRVREEVARFVDMPQADPSAPGPYRYADVSRLLALLAQAGLGELEARVWRGELPIGGGLAPEAAADFALAAFSNFGELLAQAGDDVLLEARRAVTSLFQGHVHGGAVRLGACAHLVTGARP